MLLFLQEFGGIDKGFETVYANEIDKNAAVTFKANFPNVPIAICDIQTLDAKKDIPAFDIMIAGFPCQAFSVAGYRQGFDDEKGRGNLFFDLIRIIDEKKPSVLFLENVKNLVGHDDGKTYARIEEELTTRGYDVTPMVLNVPIIRTHSGDIRKLTPRECFNLQGFPDDFIVPNDLSNASLYKQAGNSVAVTVIERIAKNIMEAVS